MATCAYCGTRLYASSTTSLKNRKTLDHVYPKASYNWQERSPVWRALNLVPCCHPCNSYKGRLHPLDWLVIMSSNDHAKALAERLVKMGEDMAEVFDAMRRRKR